MDKNISSEKGAMECILRFKKDFLYFYFNIIFPILPDAYEN